MAEQSQGVGRRGFLTGVGVATGALVALTAGQTFGPLAPVNFFGPRDRNIGPQGIPVNRTVAQARVRESALDPSWTLTVASAAGAPMSLSRADLARLPQTTARLPIACVEGWSASAEWTGVPLRALLNAAGMPETATVKISSLQERGTFRATKMTPEFARDPLTLVALKLNGEDLHIEHGFPARIMAPARSGVLQTKWLSSITEES